MVGGLIAANSSTILTHLNWGSSYLVHDFYRRFIAPDADEKHYVIAGRVCTVGLYVVAAFLSLLLESAQEAFEILISIGAGTGLLYLLRWFWWRINAWCEVVAMVSSFAVSIVFFVLRKTGNGLPFAQTVLISVGVHDGLLADRGLRHAADEPRAPDRVLQESAPVRARLDGDPRGRGRHRGGSRAAQRPHGQGDRSAGSPAASTIWSSLFAIGNFLYGRTQLALILTAVFVVSGLVLLVVVNTLWDRKPIADC